jgi:hypothetical protein
MDIDVTVTKDGQVIGREHLEDPSEGDVADAIGRITGAERRRTGKTIWPVVIDVREPSDDA